MEYIDGNNNLYTFIEVLKEKQREVMVNNLKSLLKSKHIDFIVDLFEQITYCDNYSEQWGGVRYENESLVEEINRVIKLETKRSKYLFSANMECFLIDCCVPVLETILEYKIITIKGYQLTVPMDLMINEDVVVKKNVKKGYCKAKGLITKIEKPLLVKGKYSYTKKRFKVEFTKDNLKSVILNDDQILFPAKKSAD